MSLKSVALWLPQVNTWALMGVGDGKLGICSFSRFVGWGVGWGLEETSESTSGVDTGVDTVVGGSLVFAFTRWASIRSVTG